VNEHVELRNKVVKETEDYVKELQAQYELTLPEKQKLIEENQQLRRDIDACVKDTMSMKDSIEDKMKEKDEKTVELENEYKNSIRSKMEEMTFNAQKYLMENSEYKGQIINYQKKNEEMSGAVAMFNVEYDKLKK